MFTGRIVTLQSKTVEFFILMVLVTACGSKKDSDKTYPSVIPGAVNLPRTGQTTCYDTAGKVISCAGTGQDGELRKGVAWPNPRFTNPDGTVPITESTVLDQLTGLIWTRDGNAPGPATCSPGVTKAWEVALNYMACLNKWNYLGYSDWHLPNRKEFRSLVNYEQIHPGTWLNDQGFTNVQTANYWSSSSDIDNPIDAWLPDLWYGVVNVGTKIGKHYAWPVRSGQ